MTPVMEGTLDAHGQEDLASGLSARKAAEKHYDEELAEYTTRGSGGGSPNSPTVSRSGS